MSHEPPDPRWLAALREHLARTAPGEGPAATELAAWQHGEWPAAAAAAFEERLLLDPAACQQAAAWFAGAAAPPGRWLHLPLRLPASAAAFASTVARPFRHTVSAGAGWQVSLAEESAGCLALYVQGPTGALAGQVVRLVLEAGERGEPLALELPLRALGEHGVGARVELGPLPELLARLGPAPSCHLGLPDPP
ncbi:MAG: hypothetical protein IT204_18075 [Fimbriimonadaceae bacterium]|nr:hypothetical protein [Fimbriimonadaceae bacterium]